MEQKNPPKAEEPAKNPVAAREEEILRFWQENRIFEKTQEGKDHCEEFVFYDGPPFATGTPHYGHLIGGTMKDAFPRYQTMRGKRVERRWGWDCHGLPLENLIEKELGLKTKKDIEELGIGKFNAAAKAAVLRYESEWKKIVPRLGRFVDMENSYKTMDSSYTETIWWMFKTLNDKGLVEKGFKSMHLCPRCGTTLSNFEVNQGYKDIADISAYAKFALKDEPDTFMLAWTTTPWTLPGNVALAVNSEIQYVKAKVGEEFYIFAESRREALEKLLKDGAKFEIIKNLSSSNLEGKAYEPLYPYYKDMKMTHPDRAWKIYSAPFVTAEDGTGIVHIAPAFGSDDLSLARAHHLPLIQHVGMDGNFKKEVKDFSGPVKPKDTAEEKDAHQKADIEVIKNLAHRGLLFAKEKMVHSYPHCWRCETPLLNYATTSWFVKVPKIKAELIEENKKVKWVPEAIGKNRFGEWLEGSPDWAVSRSRYWGAPLPVWICHSCEKMEFFGSIEDLKKRTSRGTEFFLMRHGEGEHNILNLMSSGLSSPHHLTENGKARAEKTGLALKDKGIDLVIASPLLRTKETAQIAAKALGIAPEKIIFDDRLMEVDFGDWNGGDISRYRGTEYFKDTAEKFSRPVPGGECLNDIRKRVGEFLYEADEKYAGKKILVVSHQGPLWLMLANIEGLNQKETIAMRGDKDDFMGTATVLETAFAPIPHNDLYELDFHRPFIDEVRLTCGCKEPEGRKSPEGGEDDSQHSDAKHGLMERVPEVFDCWFESGSMPYGQQHYMGKPLPKFDPEKNVGFPADFIAEGLDQTRGWFYSMLVLGVALFGKSPYKNVAVNGLILAEDGRKMSKSLKNYPDPMDVVSKYGADALRYYLLSSPATHAEDLNFSEKGVDGIYKKLILRLGNVVSFYEMYADKNLAPSAESADVLDRWMLSRLSELREEVTANMEKYEIDKALRPFDLFVDDLSTWYVRRSRDRFKSENVSDRNAALATTRFVLLELAKLLAPFTPFIAEEISLKTKTAEGKESVHLELWPKEMKCDEPLLEDMKAVRAAVTLGLEARMKANIKVRQPLAKLTMKSEALEGKKEYLALIEDEVNVKEVSFDKNLATEAELDTNLTPALREEGEMRELIRAIQDARKEAKLDAKDKVKLIAAVSEEKARLLQKFFDSEIGRVCNLSGLEVSATDAGDKFSFV